MWSLLKKPFVILWGKLIKFLNIIYIITVNNINKILNYTLLILIYLLITHLEYSSYLNFYILYLIMLSSYININLALAVTLLVSCYNNIYGNSGVKYNSILLKLFIKKLKLVKLNISPTVLYKYNRVYKSNTGIQKFIWGLVSLKQKLPIYWYTLFKRSSIFGFYKINSQKWIENTTEEVNYIKY